MQQTTKALSSASSDSGISARPSGLQFVSVPDLAEETLRRSGIERGMRVLELECGAGDASLSIAKLIGPSGLLVGVDRSAEAIDVAERRATVAGCCYWTRFVTADPNTFVLHERFDAVVVRPALLLQGERDSFALISACVRPGGVVVFVSGKHHAGACGLVPAPTAARYSQVVPALQNATRRIVSVARTPRPTHPLFQVPAERAGGRANQVID